MVAFTITPSRAAARLNSGVRSQYGGSRYAHSDSMVDCIACNFSHAQRYRLRWLAARLFGFCGRSFSKSMVDRDFEAFSSHIAEDAIFINGGKPLRGKKQILDHWRKFFEAKEAPFEWDPEIAEPVASESLGYTEGPVRLMNGKQIARFYSTWRRDSSGKWEVVFDNGYDLCSCEQKP